MALDSFNLDLIESKPRNDEDLEAWRKHHILKIFSFREWKKLENKKVEIDGEKYRLVKIEDGESDE